MASLTVTGRLQVKYDANQVSDKFTKRDFVLMTDTESQYPQYVSFQLTQDKCALLDLFECGSIIEVHFNLRGRAWTSPQGETKYFNTLEAWRILPQGVTTPASVPNVPPVNAASTPVVNIQTTGDDGNDDLPF